MEDSLHHEILLALSGYPGNIFTVSEETNTIQVDSSLPFIHPSEVSLLNRICQLGTYYTRIRKFISDQNAVTFSLPPFIPPPSNARSGLYMKALACGIDKVLSGYRQALVNLEQKCINEPHQPLSFLQSQLESFQLLLPALEACVQHVTSERCQGPQILSYLYDQCLSGIPIIKTSFERILKVCHGVLYKQLSAWMLHGLLLDVKGEFFIDVRQKEGQGTESSREAEKSRETEKPGESESLPLQDKEFVIQHALAPAYLPLRVLEKILFVGEAVTIFQSKSDTTATERMPPGKPGGVANIGGHGRGMSTILTGAGAKFRSEQFRFTEMLTQLQHQEVFQLHEFEKVVDCIRDCVAELLWSMLVEDSDLSGHLKLMKDFYLLGRGELFLAFIDLSHHFMNALPTATTQHDVNVSFQQAMVRVGMDSERMARQFQMLVPYTKHRGSAPPPTTPPPEAGVCAWDQLTLAHSMEWPLPILFTPKVIARYNALFRLLLELRRTQISLHHSWALLMQHRNRWEELRQVWELRTQMGFLIDNLQYYVQVDVLETQFSQLLERVAGTHDYETIKHAHEKYLITLQSQLFLTQPSILHCLQELMKLCNKFSSLLLLSKALKLNPREQAEIQHIAKQFGRHSSLFFEIVSGVKVHASAPHLAQLLLRVDYNKYFSTSKRLTTTS